MGVIRNSINIEGIALLENLPKKNSGQLIKYSEVETLFIPDDKPDAKTIYEISLDINVNNDKLLQVPEGKIVVLDGIKNLKVVYTQDSISENTCVADINLPYNTFFELPAEIEDIFDINLFVLDAYFHLIDTRKVYCHFIYLIDVHYDRKKVKLKPKNNEMDHYAFINENMLNNTLFI